MKLHTAVKCKCGHPFSYHVSLPEPDPDRPRSWPVGHCSSLYKCLCLDFTITFWTWLKETIRK